MSSRALCCCLAVLSLGAPVALAQKGKPETETISGKVTSVVMKGKAATLKVETDAGDKMDVLVTPKLNFTVTAKGDKELFRPGVWVSAENAVLNEANKLYFASNLVVHVGPAPAARAQKNMNGGYDLTGQVAALEEKEMKPFLSLRPNMTVGLDDGYTVSLHTNDASLIPEEGAPVQIEGTKRGEKFLPSKVTVTLDKQVTADDVFGNKGKAKKPAPKAGKTSAADKTDKADGSVQVADPFKTGAKTPAKGTDGAPKATNPFSKKPEDAPAPKANDAFKEKPKDAPGVDAKKPGAK